MEGMMSALFYVKTEEYASVTQNAKSFQHISGGKFSLNRLSGSPLLTVFSLFGILVGIIAIISSAIGIQHFQRLASQNDPIAIGMILAIVVIVLAIAYELGWAQSRIPKPSQISS